MGWVIYIYRLLRESWYLLTGKKPWVRGYHEHKVRQIRNILAHGSFNPGRLPKHYGVRIDERIVEYPWFFSRLPREASGKLLDAGSVLNYDYLLDQQALKSKKVFISTLAPEKYSFWRRGVSYVYEDLRASCFRDNYFDWVVSLSTIEHIGMDNTMLYTSEPSRNEQQGMTCLQAVREFKRMLKPGGKLYLSVPFGKYHDHGWLQVFDAAMVDSVIEAFGPSQVREFHYRYEVDGWRVSSRDESREGTYFDIHVQKTYDPDFAAASRAIVCLELTK